jgi:hypothetical protein
MKQRMLSNWTFKRAIYLLMGSYIVFQSISDQLWIGAAMGTYFAAMGLFGFGCASGNCYNPNYNKETVAEHAVQFEKISPQ